jgi:hypothetical protein
MLEETRQAELRQQTHSLLQGPLKHVRGAALAAALLPLASVLAAPASAQSATCGSGGVCGFVFEDTNKNGLQDPGEPGIEGAKVFLIVGGDTLEADTGPDGFYYFFVPPGTYPVVVRIPTGTEPTESNVGGDDTIDSDGVPDGFGNSVAPVTLVTTANPNTDFGFFTSGALNPGTGTPGYWKNHAEAWPVQFITVGGVTYTKAQAIGRTRPPPCSVHWCRPC